MFHILVSESLYQVDRVLLKNDFWRLIFHSLLNCNVYVFIDTNLLSSTIIAYKLFESMIHFFVLLVPVNLSALATEMANGVQIELVY